MEMINSFSHRLEQLASKVDSTSGATNNGTSTEVPPSPSPSTNSRTGNWADCPPDESMAFCTAIQWPDDKESETPGNLVDVSQETISFSNHASEGL